MNEPITPRYKALMNTLAKILDEAFNGSAGKLTALSRDALTVNLPYWRTLP